MSTPTEIASLCNGVFDDYGYYVYYLCDDQRILYVGQSTRLLSRVNHHIHGRTKKCFRYLMFRQCASEGEMRRLEAQEIQRLRPPLNKHIPEVPLTAEERRLRQVEIARLVSAAIESPLKLVGD
jgi:hypothetical protein